MKALGLNEIREKYLSFFESKGHYRLPSFSLIPKNDPSILLINAGMTPLKPYFTGAEKPPALRVTTCQKCVRTQDIENVGFTARHGTFFEMLGNFSFGDYFKNDAISWAWEFCTKVLEMPEDRLYVTIYEDDDEAYDIWHNKIGLDPARIFRFGKADNFWEHGTGPCGPCSELYFDRGEAYGCGDPNCTVGCECDRFIEFWNLVFTQFDRDEAGNYLPLKQKNIDTGCGLERLASIMQDAGSIFEVDTVKAVLDKVCQMAGVKYGDDKDHDVAIRVITDHIRSTVMMISDGIEPSNERRGYVLRRLIRRAARYGKKLGIEDIFLTELADVVISQSKSAYPDLADRYDYIIRVIANEEKAFAKTIKQGSEILDTYIKEAKAQGKSSLTGDQVFKLHDTFGFPLDLTKEIAAEQDLAVDLEAFQVLMHEQKARARKATLENTDSAWDVHSLPDTVDQSKPTDFLGYEDLEAEGDVLYLLQSDERGLTTVESAMTGEPVLLISNRTPFYAESGGQVGDQGWIEGPDCRLEVSTVTKNPNKIFIHQAKVVSGQVHSGDHLTFKVNPETRLATERNHTGTHILHQALHQVLGNHVDQAGSLVEPDRLRFDFKHYQPVAESELREIEAICNKVILADLPVSTQVMDLNEAKASGARALFGEKYADKVRVVSVGDFSKELCGGTHLSHSSQLGSLRILSETGSAAGVRRIEAVTGQAAYDQTVADQNLIHDLSGQLKTGPDAILSRVEQLQTKQKEIEKELASIKAKEMAGFADRLLDDVQDVGKFKLVTAKLESVDADQLRQTGDKIRDHFQDQALLVALAAANEGKVVWLIMATESAVKQGVHAGQLIKEAAKVTGGGGGGRPDMAQAGGKDASKIEVAFDLIKDKLQAI